MSFVRRIVIDTGVLVSAAIRPESVPALALEKALLQFDVCVNEETWAELEEVLMRPKFDRYLPQAKRQQFLEGLRSRTLTFSVVEAVSDCTDPKDNKFLALAAAADAELILASDPHLAGLHPWRDIPILPPTAFLVGIR